MKQAAVFILLGQSNAVGHALPMQDSDKILSPLTHVFGLQCCDNQHFDPTTLKWSGYTSGGMNLGETQDHTYSLANCLAARWQQEINNGTPLPDLFIIQIAIGAQGVTQGYMWNPNYPKRLIPGKLGTADIALFPLTLQILSRLTESIHSCGYDRCYIQLHWRGGENDMGVDRKLLETKLKEIYLQLFHSFRDAIGQPVPITLHRLVCHERCLDRDPTGGSLKGMDFINTVFESLADEDPSINLFDPRTCPHYQDGIRCNGIFMPDAVHFTRQTNEWVTDQIFRQFQETFQA